MRSCECLIFLVIQRNACTCAHLRASVVGGCLLRPRWVPAAHMFDWGRFTTACACGAAPADVVFVHCTCVFIRSLRNQAIIVQYVLFR